MSPSPNKEPNREGKEKAHITPKGELSHPPAEALIPGHLKEAFQTICMRSAVLGDFLAALADIRQNTTSDDKKAVFQQALRRASPHSKTVAYLPGDEDKYVLLLRALFDDSPSEAPQIINSVMESLDLENDADPLRFAAILHASLHIVDDNLTLRALDALSFSDGLYARTLRLAALEHLYGLRIEVPPNGQSSILEKKLANLLSTDDPHSCLINYYLTHACEDLSLCRDEVGPAAWERRLSCFDLLEQTVIQAFQKMGGDHYQRLLQEVLQPGADEPPSPYAVSLCLAQGDSQSLASLMLLLERGNLDSKRMVVSGLNTHYIKFATVPCLEDFKQVAERFMASKSAADREAALEFKLIFSPPDLLEVRNLFGYKKEAARYYSLLSAYVQKGLRETKFSEVEAASLALEICYPASLWSRIKQSLAFFSKPEHGFYSREGPHYWALGILDKIQPKLPETSRALKMLLRHPNSLVAYEAALGIGPQNRLARKVFKSSETFSTARGYETAVGFAMQLPEPDCSESLIRIAIDMLRKAPAISQVGDLAKVLGRRIEDGNLEAFDVLVKAMSPSLAERYNIFYSSFVVPALLEISVLPALQKKSLMEAVEACRHSAIPSPTKKLLEAVAHDIPQI